MSEFGLQLEDVRKSYGSHRVLAGVTLSVRRGSATVLLGASGSGKSTLLRLLAGLERVDGGRITIDGSPLLPGGADRTVGRVGLVFQGLELWPNLSVQEHLAYGLPRGLSRAQRSARVAQLAEQVGLDAEHLRRRPGTLSGGEQQRVAIARTLGSEPSLLLFDEPLASLDPERRQGLRQVIRALAEEGSHTLLLVTHDVLEACALGDEIAVLDQGCIVDQGSPNQIYMAPRTLASARALGLINALPATAHGTRLHTALGDLAATGSSVEGAIGWALLRPEQLSLLDEPGAAGTVPGRVKWAHARGPDYMVGVEMGEQLVWARSLTRPTAGAHVHVRPLAQAVFVRAEGGAA